MRAMIMVPVRENRLSFSRAFKAEISPTLASNMIAFFFRILGCVLEAVRALSIFDTCFHERFFTLCIIKTYFLKNLV